MADGGRRSSIPFQAEPIAHSPVGEEEEEEEEERSTQVTQILQGSTKTFTQYRKQIACFCVVEYEKTNLLPGYRPYNILWYVIDDEDDTVPKDTQEKSILLTPHMTMTLAHARVGFGSFTFKSDLYLLGGSHFPDSRCLPNVIRSTEFGSKFGIEWQSYRQMRSPRCSPAVVVKDDQVYVFGGTLSKGCPWGELYYVKRERWVALSNPPADVHLNRVLVGCALLKDDILLVFDDFKQEGRINYSFNVETKAWSVAALLPHNFNWPKSLKETPYVDGVLYSCNCRGVYATGYDVLNGEKFTERVSGLELDDSRNSADVSSSHLVYLGEMEFCLLMVYHRASSGGLQAHYTRFHIKKSVGSAPFAAVNVSSGTYSFQGDEFCHCLSILASCWSASEAENYDLNW